MRGLLEFTKFIIQEHTKMKSLYTKLIVTLGLSTALTVPMARAEIPFTQARGMYEQTKDDKKNISPFWGMVAIHGKMLERIRFYGNYASAPNPEAVEDDAENIRMVDQGKDPIAALIKRLFNSPDGVQFVATTYELDPVGNLSRNLPAINGIIEILLTVTETPKKIAAITKIINEITPGPNTLNEQVVQKKITRQLESQLKVNRKNFVEEKMQQRVKGFEGNKNDFEKAEFQKLKGVNEGDLIKLAKEKNITIKDNLKADDISRLKQQISNKIFKDLITEQKRNVLKEFFEDLELSFNSNLTNSELIDLYVTEAIKPELEKVIATFPRETILPIAREQLEKENADFAKLLVNAFEAEKTIANPSIPDKYLYPENIVITALLGFFVKVANDASQLKSLPYLMEATYEGASDPFDEKTYENLKKEYIEGKEMPNLEILKNPETAFLMAKGYTAYEYPYAEPIPYTGNTLYRKGLFPDCGETSLRNVLGLFLSANNQGKISSEALKSLLGNIKSTDNSHLQPGSPFQNMMLFFNTYPDMTVAGVQKVHNDWAEVVSNLNNGVEAQSLNDVYYGHSSEKRGPQNYEIKSALKNAKNKVVDARGIINMLNVISKLIPDDKLQEPWSPNRKQRFKQISEKLTRFCDLLSRDGLKISWVNEETEEQDINNEFMNVTFLNNETPIFNWEFVEGHFQLNPLPIGTNDWRLAYQSEKIFTPDYFKNEWMASIFRSFDYTYHHEEGPFGKFLPLSLVYNASLKNYKGASNTIGWVLKQNMVAYKPLIMRWIQKSIPLNDHHASYDLWSTLTRENNAIDIIDKLLNQQDIKKNLKFLLPQGIINAARYGQIKMMEYLLEKGAPMNGSEDDYSGDDTPLVAAIKNGQSKAILFLLEKGADVNAANKGENAQNRGVTPLHAAALKGDGEIVKLLVDNGANVNAREFSSQNETPLTWALKGKNLKIAEFLLQHEAQLDPDRALAIAIEQDNGNTLKFLLSKGIDINTKMNHRDDTPLLDAASAGKEAIVKLLLETPEIDINAKNSNGTSPLEGAVSNGHENIVKTLLADQRIKYNPDELAKWRSIKSTTDLIEAAKKGNIEKMDSLLKQGASIDGNKGDYEDETPLIGAIMNNQPKAILFLLEKGANVNATNGKNAERLDNVTPLQLAAREGNEEIVKILINHGADINAKNIDGISPLQAAAYRGRENIVELLISDQRIQYNPEDLTNWRRSFSEQQNADFSDSEEDSSEGGNYPGGGGYGSDGSDEDYGGGGYGSDEENNPPLLQAVIDNREDDVRRLLESPETDINGGGGGYSSPLEAAASQGYESIVNLLLEDRRLKYNPEDLAKWIIEGKTKKLTDAAKNGKIDEIPSLLQQGALINGTQKEYGNLTPPLIAAINNGHMGAVSLLLQNGADVNVVSQNYSENHGDTPLHVAALKGNEELVLFLIKNKADINRKSLNYSGATPLIRAIEGKNFKIIELLIQNGAQINLSQEETSPLYIAVQQNDENAVKFLINKGANANQGDQYGSPPLLQAVINNNEAIVKILLLAPGVDINVMGGYSNTSPLKAAAQSGYETIVELLLKDPRIKYDPEDLEKWRSKYKQIKAENEAYQNQSDSESDD